MLGLNRFFKYMAIFLIALSVILLIWRVITEMLPGGELTDIYHALAISFCIFIPGLLILYTALNVQAEGASARSAWLAIFIALPVIMLAIGVQIVSHISIWISLLIFCVGAFMLFWGILILRHCRN